MRISPTSLRAFSPASYRPAYIDAIRQGPVMPVMPVQALEPLIDPMHTPNLLWASGKFSGSAMRRLLFTAWQRSPSRNPVCTPTVIQPTF